MTAPKRIQLRRTKGWRKPEGAVVVARPSRWGNPWKVGDRFIYGGVNRLIDREFAAALYRGDLETGGFPSYRDCAIWIDIDLVRSELRGRDLACWCPTDQPCHADVLLELANHPDTTPQEGNQ